MGDYITEAELKRLKDSGADIEHMKVDPLEVKGLGAVLDAINRSIAANQLLIQQQAANVDKIIKAFNVVVGETRVNNNVDTQPIAEAISQLSNNQPKEAIPYTFNIERDQRGFMKSVEVTPRQPTIN